MAAKKKGRGAKRTSLKPIRPMVAGIDIGGTEHWVCGPEHKKGEREVRVFGATTPELKKMAAWLREQKVESIAMESTYIYWIPVLEVLAAEGFEVVLVNARTLKNVPGRKTDMHDCQWLQLLHSCGLLRGSFRPEDEVCQLRALQRQRANLVDERSRIVHWMQKSLDQMNVRVHRAVSDITGTTGMKIIRAIVDGERDPLKLATFRDKRCKKSEEDIAEHLTGTWRQEHLFNLTSALSLYDQIEASIHAYDQELLRVLDDITPEDRRDEEVPEHPNANKAKAMHRRGETGLRNALFRFAGVDLTTIDGISAESARVILTEVGPDISAFPTEKHFISWLHLCPRTPISGGKPLKGKKNSLGASRVGAIAPARGGRPSRGSPTAARRDLPPHRSSRKSAAVAVFAVARKLAQLRSIASCKYGTEYVDIGAERLRAGSSTIRRLFAALAEECAGAGPQARTGCGRSRVSFRSETSYGHWFACPGLPLSPEPHGLLDTHQLAS
jgi:transposase